MPAVPWYSKAHCYAELASGDRTIANTHCIYPSSDGQAESGLDTGRFIGPEPDPTRSRYTQARRDPDLFWSMVYATCR